MAILGQLAALVYYGQSAGGVHTKNTARTTIGSEFYFEREIICWGTFLFLYGTLHDK